MHTDTVPFTVIVYPFKDSFFWWCSFFSQEKKKQPLTEIHFRRTRSSPRNDSFFNKNMSNKKWLTDQTSASPLTWVTGKCTGEGLGPRMIWRNSIKKSGFRHPSPDPLIYSSWEKTQCWYTAIEMLCNVLNSGVPIIVETTTTGILRMVYCGVFLS